MNLPVPPNMVSKFEIGNLLPPQAKYALSNCMVLIFCDFQSENILCTKTKKKMLIKWCKCVATEFDSSVILTYRSSNSITTLRKIGCLGAWLLGCLAAWVPVCVCPSINFYKQRSVRAIAGHGNITTMHYVRPHNGRTSLFNYGIYKY